MPGTELRAAKQFNKVDNTEVFISKKRTEFKSTEDINPTDREDARLLLQENGLRLLTYKEALVLIDRNPELKEQLKGKWFYFWGKTLEGAESHSEYYTFDNEGTLSRNVPSERDPERTVMGWVNNNMTLAVFTDDETASEGRRFVLNANGLYRYAKMVVGVPVEYMMATPKSCLVDLILTPVERPSSVPKSFTAISQPIELRTSEHSEGVVLDTLDDVEEALRRYETGTLPSSRHPERALPVTFNNPLLGWVAAYALAERKKDEPDFTSRIMEEAREADANGKRSLFKRFYQYDAAWTSFFETSVKITKCDGRYILSVTPEQDGGMAEAEIRTAMNAYAALRSASLEVTYMNVDMLWFNIDLAPYAQIFRNLDTAIKHSSLFTDHGLINQPLSFTYNGQIFEVPSFEVESTEHYYNLRFKERCTRETLLLATKGMILSGAAKWRDYPYIDDYDNIVATIPEGFVVPEQQPQLKIEVRLPPCDAMTDAA